jgi:hypothetical protein
MVRAALILLLALAAPPVWAHAGEADPANPAAPSSTVTGREVPSLQAIEDGLGRRTRLETIHLIEAWVDAHPGDPDVPKAVTWAGHLLLQIKDVPAARRTYGRAIAMGGIWSFRASAALGDMEMLERHYTAAIAAYEAASSSPEEGWASYGREGAATARVARREAYTATGFAAALSLQTAFLAIAAWRRRGWAAFWPLPWELKFYLPFAVLMSLATASILPSKRGTIRTVCWGGLGVIGGYAVYFRTATITPGKRIIGSLLAIASAAALIYASLVAFGLLGTIGAGGEGE